MNSSSSNNLTRRSFVKQSTLTVGAAALISRGVGLAVDGATAAPCAGECIEFKMTDEQVYTSEPKFKVGNDWKVVPGSCYVVGKCYCHNSKNPPLNHTPVSSWKKAGDNNTAVFRTKVETMQHVAAADGPHAELHP